ncbi:MAG: M24 family metallopeptidase C-terminal domain-containing protein [Myxococcota bacterium]
MLKGHIALARAVFPEVFRSRLDTLARTALWSVGLDYGHGTGHRVGAYLNVHEGPQSINPARDTGVPLEVGNVLSNEPGYYKEGAYGIRIENLVTVRPWNGAADNGRKFLEFETLTVCPIDVRLVDVELLTTDERHWLNEYHRMVLSKVGSHLDASEKRWLKSATAPI